MYPGLERLIADAEYSVRHLKFARLRRGQYLSSYGPPGGPPTCCLVGAAALLSCTEQVVEQADVDDVSFLDRLQAYYRLTDEHIDGVVDGFDGQEAAPRTRAMRDSAEYKAGLEAGRQFADRMVGFFS